MCREFGISPRTGYKILERYEECGWEGLTDRARRPHRYANALPVQMEAAIMAAKREKPSWGARKTRERLLRRLPHEVKMSACSNHSRDSRPAWARNTGQAVAYTLRKHGAISRADAQRALVRRLQRRVQAGQRKILLSAHGRRGSVNRFV